MIKCKYLQKRIQQLSNQGFKSSFLIYTKNRKYPKKTFYYKKNPDNFINPRWSLEKCLTCYDYKSLLNSVAH